MKVSFVCLQNLPFDDGDEGQVEFLAPVYSGDFIEATGRIIKVGNTSRKITFEAYKVIASIRGDVQV